MDTLWFIKFFIFIFFLLDSSQWTLSCCLHRASKDSTWCFSFSLCQLTTSTFPFDQSAPPLTPSSQSGSSCQAGELSAVDLWPLVTSTGDKKQTVAAAGLKLLLLLLDLLLILILLSFTNWIRNQAALGAALGTRSTRDQQSPVPKTKEFTLLTDKQERTGSACRETQRPPGT